MSTTVVVTTVPFATARTMRRSFQARLEEAALLACFGPSLGSSRASETSGRRVP